MAGKGRGNNNPSPPSFDGTPAVRTSISFPAGNHRALKAFGPVFQCKRNLCKAFPELPQPEGPLNGSPRGCRKKKTTTKAAKASIRLAESPVLETRVAVDLTLVPC